MVEVVSLGQHISLPFPSIPTTFRDPTSMVVYALLNRNYWSNLKDFFTVFLLFGADQKIWFLNLAFFVLQEFVEARAGFSLCSIDCNFVVFDSNAVFAASKARLCPPQGLFNGGTVGYVSLFTVASFLVTF